MFQSTHPHGVRLRCTLYFPSGIQVSIHAPARGATYADKLQLCCLSVSIHAPARGATSAEIAPSQRTQFQSTHPHGVRLFNRCRSNTAYIVSIHAPARGATEALRINLLASRVSIHAPARGATEAANRLLEGYGFNPRTRTGCDQDNQDNGTESDCFNPRTRTGCDGRGTDDTASCPVSIHAPARGAT